MNDPRNLPPPFQIRLANFLKIAFVVLSFSRSSDAASLANTDIDPVPYQSGHYRQLVRKFYTSADGLSTNSIVAVAAARNGAVFATSGGSLARLQNDRWQIEEGPTGVSAIFGPAAGPLVLSAGTNGIWALSNEGWKLESNGPSNGMAFSSEPDGTVWILAPSGVWRRSNGWQRIHSLDEDIEKPRSILPQGPEDVLLASENGLYGMMGKRKYWLDFAVRPGELLSSDTRSLARLDAEHFLVATDKGLNLSNGKRGWYSFTGNDGLPILNLTHVAVASDGTVWLGSEQGLIRWRTGQWTYLSSKRWLPNDRVNCIAPAPDGSVWVGTPQGLSHLYFQNLTLEEKAGILQKDLESRPRRHGFVTVLQLRKPGSLDGALQEISDNDGLWTSMYVAAESFRFAVTKSPDAKAQAWRSMQAVLRLESLTGISGFPARAICHVSEPQFPARSIRSQPEWHESPVEKDWYWKGETSSDELDGHYFGWYLFYDLAANDQEKEQIRATCRRVTDHILDHGYYLIDKDGKRTTWGVWAPEKLNDDPMWWQERGLNSLEILSHLKVAAHIVGDPRYESAYRDLIQKHRYAINTLPAKISSGVSHDNQLLFLAYYPLLQLERDPGLRAIYSASISRTWEFERKEGCPLWNFIYGASTGRPCDIEPSVEALREIPLDFILWRMKNSRRADLRFDPNLESRGIKRLLRPLPWTERVIHKWDKNPFELDDGSDLSEGDQTIWLLPYWMGRFHRLIDG